MVTLATNNPLGAGLSAQNLEDLVPDDLKLEYPEVIKAFAQLYLSGVALEHVQPVMEIAKNLEPGICLDPTSANAIVDNCSNHTSIINNREAITSAMCSGSECPNHVKEIVKNTLGKAANGILTASAISGGIHLFSTFMSLASLSRAMEELDILVAESGPEITSIQNSLKVIPQKLEELASILQDLGNESISSAEVRRLNARQKQVAGTIEKLLNDLSSRIDVALERCQVVREQLQIARQRAFTAGVGGVVGGGVNLANTYVLRNAGGSPLLLGANLVIGGLNLILGATAIYKSTNMKEKIMVIVQIIVSMKQLKTQVEDYKRQADDYKQQIVDMILELSVN